MKYRDVIFYLTISHFLGLILQLLIGCSISLFYIPFIIFGILLIFIEVVSFLKNKPDNFKIYIPTFCYVLSIVSIIVCLP
jgi:hypothetical protein